MTDTEKIEHIRQMVFKLYASRVWEQEYRNRYSLEIERRNRVHQKLPFLKRLFTFPDYTGVDMEKLPPTPNWKEPTYETDSRS
jgi:hypothetical protein